MADNNKNKAPTHTAFGFYRQGRKFGRWLEIGTARADDDGMIRVFLDRIVYGHTGGVLLAPIGKEPPLPQPPPRRPGDIDEDDELDA
jgi:hypothetical protein